MTALGSTRNLPSQPSLFFMVGVARDKGGLKVAGGGMCRIAGSFGMGVAEVPVAPEESVKMPFDDSSIDIPISSNDPSIQD